MRDLEEENAVDLTEADLADQGDEVDAVFAYDLREFGFL